MFQRFDRLSLRTKLAAGFALVIGLALALAGTSLLSQRRGVAAVEEFLDRDNRIAELALQSSAEMIAARRSEKDFLLKVREFGFEEAKARYATGVRAHLAEVRSKLAAIRALAGAPEISRETADVEAVVDRYEEGFLRMVALYGRLGRRDSGLEGRFRERAHGIERLLQHGAPPPLMTGLLALRRAEKDFLLRGLARDALAFDEGVARFRREVTGRVADPTRRGELLRLADEYHDLFRQYRETDAEIDATARAYLEAVHTVEPAIERLHAHAGDAAARARVALRELSASAARTAAEAGIGALLLALVVIGLVVRNLDRAVGSGVAFADRLAGGDLTARLPEAGRNEFAVLAGALNRMADKLQQAHLREAAGATQLHRLNRTLRMLSRCGEALVRADGEAELLQDVCRQVVEIGGYPLAWIGYARHDPGKSVEPAAFAGVGRAYVDHLNLSWGDDDARRGTGGTAIREGRLAVARHIATDPVFASWRAAALDCGFASCISLPLQNKAGVFGVLSIYSSVPDAFDTAERELLLELAMNLAYGITNLRQAEARQKAEQELAYRSQYDALTGLPNRILLCDRLGQALAHAGRSGRRVAMLILGLDRFKAINDSLGHGAGDALLRHVGTQLAAVLRQGDTVARLAGDEFAVLLADLADEDDVAPLARKLLAAAALSMAWEGRELSAGASLGISVHPQDGADPETLIRNADVALGSAKSQGGDAFQFYGPEMNRRVSERFALEADLRLALERGELRLHYHPKVSLKTGALTGAEALVRWQHPTEGLLSAVRFVPLAEETGLIQAIGDWVLQETCRQLRAWLDAGLAVPPVAVNLSARQFRQGNLAARIAATLAAHRLEACSLDIEITESMVMHDVEQAVTTLAELKGIGVSIALDDFGTGYSSLSYLKRFPIDILKIDRAFVRDVADDPDDAAICLAVIGLAHNLKLKVIAEGIETEAQLGYLRAHHCDEMQGFYFSRPLPADDFAALVAAGSGLVLPTEAAQPWPTTG